MNVLFVFSLDQIYSFEKPLFSQQQIQFGISYISSILKKNNIDTSLVVLSKLYNKRSQERVIEAIKATEPSLICFTAVATEYSFINSIASQIKREFPNIYLLIGGPHASLNPQILTSSSFDALCIGEGEYPTLELAKTIQKKAIPHGISNLWIKQKNNIQKNTPRPFNTNLDDYPLPDRKMWQQWICENYNSILSILLGRGCPFNCSYCCNHALRKIASGQYVRVRSIKNIIKELTFLINANYITNKIHLEIETIGVDKKWTIGLANAIEQLNKKARKQFSYVVNLRIIPGYDYNDMFLAFQKAKIEMLNIGLESGSERIRKTVLRRTYTNKQLSEVVKLARFYGLKISFFNLIGVPGETKRDFQKTVQMNRLCRPDETQTSIFYPYPGTDLYNYCINKKLITDDLDNKMERTRAVLDLPEFSRQEIQRSYDWFDYYVYKGRMNILRIIARVLRRKVSSHSFLTIYLRKIDTFLWQVNLYKTLRRLISFGGE